MLQPLFLDNAEVGADDANGDHQDRHTNVYQENVFVRSVDLDAADYAHGDKGGVVGQGVDAGAGYHSHAV